LTREELLKKAKPILFNTKMVRAILNGRKTVTRRLAKVPPYYPHFYKLHDNSDGAFIGAKNRLFAGFYKDEQIFYIDGEKHIDAVYYKAPYQPEDVLYVRETWNYGYIETSDTPGSNEMWFESICPNGECGEYIKALSHYFYKADEYVSEKEIDMIWRPSIHMPKKAARIFLKVKNVYAERLRDISGGGILKEGVPESLPFKGSAKNAFDKFAEIWDSTIKKSDIDHYGWEANPWVWVIEFETIEPERVG
jgi:hypothetical protein